MMFLDSIERDGIHTVKKYSKHYEMVRDAESSLLDRPIIDTNPDFARYVDDSRGPTTFWRQFFVLILRDLTIAARNPFLYYLQFFLLIVIGIFVGSVFYATNSDVDVSIKNVPAGIVWIIFMMAYVQIFKVFPSSPLALFSIVCPLLSCPLLLCPLLSCLHRLQICVSVSDTPSPNTRSMQHNATQHNTQIYHLSRGSALFKHERANNTCSVLATFFADLTTTAVGLLTVIPGSAVAYFMMGFPNEAYPFIMFVFWMVSLA